MKRQGNKELESFDAEAKVTLATTTWKVCLKEWTVKPAQIGQDLLLELNQEEGWCRRQVTTVKMVRGRMGWWWKE